MNRPNPIARVQGRAPVPQSPSRPYQRVVAQQNQYTTHRPPATQFQQLASPSSQNESPYPSQQNYQQFETSESFEESQPMSQLPRVQRASTDLPSRDVVDRYRQNPLSSANRLRTEGHPSSPAPGPPGGSRANVKASEVLLAKIAGGWRWQLRY